MGHIVTSESYVIDFSKFKSVNEFDVQDQPEMCLPNQILGATTITASVTKIIKPSAWIKRPERRSTIYIVQVRRFAKGCYTVRSVGTVFTFIALSQD